MEAVLQHSGLTALAVAIPKKPGFLPCSGVYRSILGKNPVSGHPCVSPVYATPERKPNLLMLQLRCWQSSLTLTFTLYIFISLLAFLY